MTAPAGTRRVQRNRSQRLLDLAAVLLVKRSMTREPVDDQPVADLAAVLNADRLDYVDVGDEWPKCSRPGRGTGDKRS
jgi:hypothetical protein